MREIPEAPRPLGGEGTRTWQRVWQLNRHWIDPVVDIEWVTLLCEAVDERVMLRMTVLRDGEWRDRVALRAVDAQIQTLLARLGLNPVERAALAPTDTPPGKLAALRASRGA